MTQQSMADLAKFVKLDQRSGKQQKMLNTKVSVKTRNNAHRYKDHYGRHLKSSR